MEGGDSWRTMLVEDACAMTEPQGAERFPGLEVDEGVRIERNPTQSRGS